MSSGEHSGAYHYHEAANDETAILRNYLLANNSGSGSVEHAHEELFKITPEVTVVHLGFTLLSVFTVFFGVFSALIKEKLFVGEAIIATVVGIALSQWGAGLFAPQSWGGSIDVITLEVTRIVIALAVFAIGVELPKAYVKKHWQSLAILLGPNMIIGWMVTSGFIYLLIPAINFLDAMIIAACLTPTDPILAASVVGKGKYAQDHVPAHIRHILQAESGANDGAAFPFLYLAMFLNLRESTGVGKSIGLWIALVVLYQILLGIIIGAAVGILARKLLKFAKRRSLIDRESMVAMYVALALFVTSATTLAGSDDLLAAFACGTAFAWDSWFLESIEDSNFSSILDLLANIAVFIYIGATIPFASFADETISLSPWRLVVLAIAILTLRRLPAIILMKRFIPDIHSMREAIFVGHFGPMGVGAIFISSLAVYRLPTPTYPPETHLDYLSLVLGPVVYFQVLCSILVHGLSIPVFTNTKRIHKRVASFSRTFTGGSTNAGEPSWITKIRKPSDIEKDLEQRRRDEDLERGEKQNQRMDTGSSGSSSEQTAVGDDKPHGDAMKNANDDAETNENGETVWREGDKIVKESADGEKVEEIPAESAGSEAFKSLHMNNDANPDEARAETTEESPRPSRRASLKGKSSRNDLKLEHYPEVNEEAEEATEEQPEERPKPKRRQSRKSNSDEEGDPQETLFKKDPKSGKLRPLTSKEMRNEQLDKAIRREKHYCTNSSEATWDRGDAIIVERQNGEVIEIIKREKDSSPSPNRPSMLRRISQSARGADSNRSSSPTAESSSVSPARPANQARPSFRDRIFKKPNPQGATLPEPISEDMSEVPTRGRPSIRFAS